MHESNYLKILVNSIYMCVCVSVCVAVFLYVHVYICSYVNMCMICLYSSTNAIKNATLVIYLNLQE